MDQLYKHIAFTLKKLRQDKGWSLDKTAKATGVSKAMLGQIEREESSPTISTLWKIASGLQTSFSSFLEEIPTQLNTPVHRTGQTMHAHPEDKQIRVHSLFPFDNELHFEIFLIELLPGCEHLSPAHKHGVVEHVLVIEGMMEVLVNGVWHRLVSGEGLRFDANQAHGYRNLMGQSAKFHDVIHYPQ